jgi:hypothetical protein
MGDRFLLLLAILLAGYALCGKGFAYIGVAPIFVGELVLLVGLIAFGMTRGWSRVLNLPAALVVLPLVALGCFRLVPGFMEYRVDALRDGVVFGYSLFALCVATIVVADPSRLPRLIAYYRRFIPIFLIGILIAFGLYHFAKPLIPTWPDAQRTPIIFVKEGDVLVHLAGILAFWMTDTRKSVKWIWTVLLAIDMSAMGVIDRAGLVSFGAVMILCLIVRPRHFAAWRTIAMLLAGIVLLYGSMVSIPVPGGKGRDISFDQFVLNFKSIFVTTSNNGLASNKEWRLEWWRKIVDYTVHGPDFWEGKGFGVNLADDDGFQVQHDHSLRSPHSVHMTFLARMGVPGFVLWELIHVVWFGSVGMAMLRSRRRGQRRWSGLFLFLFAYYMAFLINASFDVYLEGPMGGIWFWSIYGTGVGALWVYRNRPEVLNESSEPPARSGDTLMSASSAPPITSSGPRLEPVLMRAN